jgi:hypothetical protein
VSVDLHARQRLKRLTNGADRYQERLPKAWTSSLIATTSLNRRVSANGANGRPTTTGSESSDSSETTKTEDEGNEDDAVPASEALTKSYSLLFGLGQLTDELIGLHSIVSKHRPKRLRPYLLFTLVAHVKNLRWWKPRDQMRLQEALALLRGEKYTAPKVTLLSRAIVFEKWLRSDRSMCESQASWSCWRLADSWLHLTGQTL